MACLIEWDISNFVPLDFVWMLFVFLLINDVPENSAYMSFN